MFMYCFLLSKINYVAASRRLNNSEGMCFSRHPPDTLETLDTTKYRVTCKTAFVRL